VSLPNEATGFLASDVNRNTNTSDELLDRQLHSALAALPELHRSALVLRYFEEMDYRSIENLLSLTNGALRGILGRALATMRKQLRPALASFERL
jgi:RNA polymerase sigma factor (sigma-70 family)